MHAAEVVMPPPMLWPVLPLSLQPLCRIRNLLHAEMDYVNKLMAVSIFQAMHDEEGT